MTIYDMIHEIHIELEVWEQLEHSTHNDRKNV